MKLKKYIIGFLLLLSCFATESYATHIVGGVINYEWISGNNYRITARIYRDNYGGQAPFDGDPSQPQAADFVLGVYDQFGNLVTALSLTNPTITTVNPPINNNCLVIPPNIDVQEGFYSITYTIPDPTVGYYFVYQRCCRNVTINNIVSPASTGASYYAYLPPQNNLVPTHNNNPVYNEFPPLFICVNSPLVFNHSATDIDGDSLVYSICTPFIGADTCCPANTGGGSHCSAIPCPTEPPPPPYQNVQYQAPYTAANPLGGVPLSINPQTGILTGTPNTIGQFVVGVCVDEYRNGQLLSTTIRDFQFNVTQCNIPAVSVAAPNYDPVTLTALFEPSCDDLSFNFIGNVFNPPPTNVPISISWDFGDGNTSTDPNPSHTYADTGTYLITIIVTKNIGGFPCADTAHALLPLYPFIESTYSNIGLDSVCSELPVQFSDLSTSSSGPIIRWDWSFGDGNSSVVQNPAHTYASPGNYTVNLEVENDKGCIANSTGTVVVHPKPTPAFSIRSSCVNQDVQFTNSTTPGNSIYQWNFGDGGTSTSTSPTHIYSAPGPYPVTLIATSQEGCIDSLTQTIVVNPPPLVQNTSAIICPNTSAQITASNGVNYFWYPDSTLDNPNIPNPIASPTEPTIYYVIVTDQNGCFDTGTVFLDIYPPVDLDAGEDTSVCLNQSVFAYRDSVQLTGVSGGAVSYSWSPTAGLSNPNIPNPVAKPLANTDYVLTIVDTNGCTQSDTVTVVVLDPDIDLIAITDTVLCIFDSTNIDVYDQGDITTYVWTPNIGISDDSIRSPDFFPTDTTLYLLSVFNYCYSDTDSVTINVLPLPAVDARDLDSVCLFDSVELVVNAPTAVSYSWTPTVTLTNPDTASPLAFPQDTTLYFVTITDNFGCENSDSSLILVHPLPVADIFNPTDTVTPSPHICLGDSVMLEALGAGGRYQWVAHSSLIGGADAEVIVFPSDTMVYTVEVFNIHACSDLASSTVNVQLPIVPSSDLDFEVCAFETVQLNADGGFYYLWRPSLGLTDSTISDPRFSWNADTSVYFTVYIANDCFLDSAEAEVIVNPLPNADAGEDQSIFKGETTFLNASGGIEYLWYPFEIIDNPISPNPEITPFQTVDFRVRVEDENGCIAWDSVTVFVVPNTLLLLPTAFSPNGDGNNDEFSIARHLNIEKLLGFKVFNRWGEKVFETTDIEASWDGTFRDKEQEIGVYVWLIEAIDYEAEVITKKGQITLLR